MDDWTIDKKLGEGGFGAVYKCSDPTGQYALKVEGANEPIQVDVFVSTFCILFFIFLLLSFQLLKMEVFVLTELQKRGGRHFCKIEDKGLRFAFGNFNYVVMTLVGKSLQDLRKVIFDSFLLFFINPFSVQENPAQHMSMGTAIGMGIQTLEALEDLHGIGYLHRDVKSGNYTIGRAELGELRKVYILYFGMCRKFTNDQVGIKICLVMWLCFFCFNFFLDFLLLGPQIIYFSM